MDDSYFKFWGKSGGSDSIYHLLPYHNLDVAAVGYVMLELDNQLRRRLSVSLGLDEATTISFLSAFLAWHDLGKFAESFQNLQPGILRNLLGQESRLRYLLRHDSAGWLLFWHGSERIKHIIFGGDSPKLLGCLDFRDTFDVVDPVSRAIFGHHGVPPERSHALTLSTNLFPGRFESAAVEFVEASSRLLLNSPVRITSDDSYHRDRDAALNSAWLIAGFAVMCDWIGSNSELFPFETAPMALEEYWQTRAIPQAKRAIRGLGILPCQAQAFGGIAKTFGHIKQPTPLQKLCSELELAEGPQLFVIEDTTGAGKTEAAIVLAHRLLAAGHAQGIYFALPTMATANGIFERVAPVFKNLFDNKSSPSLVLAHSHRDLSTAFKKLTEVNNRFLPITEGAEPGEVGCVAWFADSRKKSLLASFGVGTVDQVLVGVLPIKHQSLRLFGASRNVLIIDEVHAFDSYVSGLLCRLIEFQACFGAPVILLSATLPISLKEKFITAYKKGLGERGVPRIAEENPYPSIDVVSAGSVTRTTFETREEVKRDLAVTYSSAKEEIMGIITSAAAAGRAVCWIRNTIQDAHEAFEDVVNSVEGKKSVTLFHSRFCHGDRQEIEERVLRTFGPKGGARERKGQILVATQVVEQSLDLDFDVLISDLAPIDLLIQRAGRLMRHSRDMLGNRVIGHDQRGLARLYVFGPAISANPEKDWYSSFFRSGSFVYPHHGKLFLTAHRLVQGSGIRVPADFRELIEWVYGIDYLERVPEHLKGSEGRAEGDDRGKSSIAEINALTPSDGYMVKGVEWSPETDTPTRLNDGQKVVTLVCILHGAVAPIFAGENGWELSEVSLPRGYTPLDTNEMSKDIGDKLEQLKATPRHRWRNFVYVESQLSCHLGVVKSKNGVDLVKFTYDKLSGLELLTDEAI